MKWDRLIQILPSVKTANEISCPKKQKEKRKSTFL